MEADPVKIGHELHNLRGRELEAVVCALCLLAAQMIVTGIAS